MNIEIIKKRIKSHISQEELAHGEIIYNNCDCQILSQSSLCIEFLVNSSDKEESVEYDLIIESYDDDNINIVPESEGERTG